MLNKKTDVQKYILNSQSEIILNTLFGNISSNQKIGNISSNQKIDNEYDIFLSFDSMSLIESKFKEYEKENFLLLDTSKKMLINKLKTNKKYLTSILK